MILWHVETNNDNNKSPKFQIMMKDFERALNRLKVTLPSNLAEVIEVSDGDIRQAINTIKFNSV